MHPYQRVEYRLAASRCRRLRAAHVGGECACDELSQLVLQGCVCMRAQHVRCGSERWMGWVGWWLYCPGGVGWCRRGGLAVKMEFWGEGIVCGELVLRDLQSM